MLDFTHNRTKYKVNVCFILDFPIPFINQAKPLTTKVNEDKKVLCKSKNNAGKDFF